MSSPTLIDSHGRVPWVGLVVLAALVAGLGVGVAQWRRQQPAAPLRPTTVDLNPDSGVIDRALASTTVDSAVIKARWIDDVRGMETGDLTPASRTLFLRYANGEHCTCGCGYTLAGCRASDMSCEISGPRLEALLDSVRTGKITRADGLRTRPSGG